MPCESRECTETPTVRIVNHHPAHSRELCRLLETAGISPRCFSSLGDFLNEFRDDGPCCLVLDLPAPGIHGAALLRRLRELGLGVTTIAVFDKVELPEAVEAMKLGAFDVLQKPFRPEPFLALVRTALDHDARAHGRRTRMRQIMERMSSLTDRERGVLQMMVSGLANKQMAAGLDLSEKTIEIHRSRVMRKMQASSLPALVRMVFGIVWHDTDPLP